MGIISIKMLRNDRNLTPKNIKILKKGFFFTKNYLVAEWKEAKAKMISLIIKNGVSF